MNIRLFIRWLWVRPKTGKSGLRRMSWSHYRNMQLGRGSAIQRLKANRERGRKAWETRQKKLDSTSLLVQAG